MYEFIHRLLVLVWFLSYMASIYLALHMVVARLSRSRDGRVLWFFGIVTSPLTRPVRQAMPPGTPEARVRLITLIVLIALWAGARAVLGTMGGVDLG